MFRILAALSFFGSASAFSPNNARPVISRKAFVDSLFIGVAGIAILPEISRADITNKLASSTELRNVKRAQKQLVNLEASVELNDYMQIRGALRKSPLGEVRKSAKTLVLGGEDGPKADALKDLYDSFITSVEKLDYTAGVAARGRKIENAELSKEYQSIISSLSEFLKVAEESVEIPVQYES
jgi:hypothetical protein